MRFGIGGLGGLLPVLASLVAVDLASDDHKITGGICLGLTIRVVGLFALGGIMAALNSEVNSPLSLVQIGIAAPALVTSYLSGVALNKNPDTNMKTSLIVSTAYAADSHGWSDILLAGDFLDDILQGITPGLGTGADNASKPLRNRRSQLPMGSKCVVALPDGSMIVRDMGQLYQVGSPCTNANPSGGRDFGTVQKNIPSDWFGESNNPPMGRFCVTNHARDMGRLYPVGSPCNNAVNPSDEYTVGAPRAMGVVAQNP